MSIHRNRKSRGAFTLVEMLITMAVFGLVMGVVMTFLGNGMMLFAKNVSANHSHNSMRTALDRVCASLTNGVSQPELITTAGAAVSSGSAAGVRYDLHLGGPYVVAHPGGTGITAGTTTVTLTRSMNALASPPVPKNGDVIFIDGSSVRLKVASATTSATDGSNRQTVSVTLSAAAGAAISWDAGSVKTASLVRRVAFVVIPAGVRNELRHFGSAEGVTNFATTAGYEVICPNIGTATGDGTPFSLSTTATDFAGRKFVDLALRVRTTEYDRRLSEEESNNFSSSMKLNISITPKGT